MRRLGLTTERMGIIMNEIIGISRSKVIRINIVRQSNKTESAGIIMSERTRISRSEMIGINRSERTGISMSEMIRINIP